ncbi:hypothetical protein BDK51DRAFT_46351 [Blyttiomyces helicus]|uniref:Uncharacterized protein n=1 Tax=Blyttiomyces helicus TaxID=388810 RepID=A0A4P9W7Q4_9FUNG|nr:hypothetical protein BDK51DRAFT_46351 [Blyttiomyces helicus]|eukprot:RKO86800.1 hypothetical protein BDK51DRAFT_46351 [Blyttiomyces helicus]
MPSIQITNYSGKPSVSPTVLPNLSAKLRAPPATQNASVKLLAFDLPAAPDRVPDPPSTPTIQSPTGRNAAANLQRVCEHLRGRLRAVKDESARREAVWRAWEAQVKVDECVKLRVAADVATREVESVRRREEALHKEVEIVWASQGKVKAPIKSLVAQREEAVVKFETERPTFAQSLTQTDEAQRKAAQRMENLTATVVKTRFEYLSRLAAKDSQLKAASEQLRAATEEKQKLEQKLTQISSSSSETSQNRIFQTEYLYRSHQHRNFRSRVAELEQETASLRAALASQQLLVHDGGLRSLIGSEGFLAEEKANLRALYSGERGCCGREPHCRASKPASGHHGKFATARAEAASLRVEMKKIQKNHELEVAAADLEQLRGELDALQPRGKSKSHDEQPAAMQASVTETSKKLSEAIRLQASRGDRHVAGEQTASGSELQQLSSRERQYWESEEKWKSREKDLLERIYRGQAALAERENALQRSLEILSDQRHRCMSVKFELGRWTGRVLVDAGVGVSERVEASTIAESSQTDLMEQMDVETISDAIDRTNAATMSDNIDQVYAATMSDAIDQVNAATISDAIDHVNAATVSDETNMANAETMSKSMSDAIDRANAATMSDNIDQVNAATMSDAIDQVNAATMSDAIDQVNSATMSNAIDHVNEETISDAINRVNAATMSDESNMANTETMSESIDRVDVSDLIEQPRVLPSIETQTEGGFFERIGNSDKQDAVLQFNHAESSRHSHLPTLVITEATLSHIAPETPNVDSAQDNWTDFLLIAEFAYNNAQHASTFQTPFWTNYSFHPRFNISLLTTRKNPAAKESLPNLVSICKELATHLKAAKESYKKHSDTHRKQTPDLEVGNKVWLLCHNVQPQDPWTS